VRRYQNLLAVKQIKGHNFNASHQPSGLRWATSDTYVFAAFQMHFSQAQH
jgi:hypothetical protein